MRKFLIISICVLLTIVVGIYVFLILPNQKSLDTVRNMTIENVNLEEVDDGLYIGDFNYSSFTYKVEIKVKNHKIEKIDIINNRDTSHSKKAEEIIIKVIDKQSVNVEAISGATTTSKALLKAIENGLKTGLR